MQKPSYITAYRNAPGGKPRGFLRLTASPQERPWVEIDHAERFGSLDEAGRAAADWNEYFASRGLSARAYVIEEVAHAGETAHKEV